MEHFFAHLSVCPHFKMLFHEIEQKHGIMQNQTCVQRTCKELLQFFLLRNQSRGFPAV